MAPSTVSSASIARLLRTGRWRAFSALVVVVVIAFGLLSHWQWQRADEREQQRLALLQRTAAPPLEVSQGLPAVPEEWQPLELSGTYEGSQFAVRRRPLEGRNGFWLVSRLVTDRGGIWVNRGWLPAADDALSLPRLPDPPSGVVVVDGYYRNPEHEDRSHWVGLPPGMIPGIVPSMMQASSLLPGYVQLTSSNPPQTDLVVLPLPQIDSSRNLSYAVQWVLFALTALAGWWFMIRREARTMEESH